MRKSLALAAAMLGLQASHAFAADAGPVSDHDRYSGAPLPPARKRPIPSPIADHLAVRGSFFAPSLNTLLRIDSSAGLTGTTVSAEHDLGLREHPYQGRMELLFRLRERNRLRVDYFETDRTGQQALGRAINFGDELFLPADVVKTALDVRMFAVTYTYSWWRTERFELGGGLGVHLIEGVTRGEVQARRQSQEVSGVAPFPTLALDGTWRISRRFAFVARGQFLRAAVDGDSASLGDYHADIQYRWRPNFSIGAGYSDLKAILQVRRGSFPGRLDVSAQGPEAFFRVSF